MPGDNVASLEVHKAEQFLKDLSALPFVALVVDEGGDLKVYTKGVTPEEIAEIKSMIAADEEE